MIGSCSESSLDERPGWRREHGLWLCPEPGEGVSLECPAGRPNATGGPYCNAHGGRARALEEAQRDWNYLAPESVGNTAAVQAAGTRALDTRHAYIVVRPNPDGGWFSWLGLGSLQEQVPRADYVGCGRPKCRSCREGKGCGRGGRHVHPSGAAAAAAAHRLWRVMLAARVDEIRAARGGTLTWGVPIAPLTEPVLVSLNHHTENAWDLAVTLPRVGPPGLGAISGLRPTGEAI